jgi:hypothetical protein
MFRRGAAQQRIAFNEMNIFTRIVLLPLAGFILLQTVPGLPQVPATSDEPTSSLVEVRDKHRALLVVFRSNILDASDNERAIIDQVLKADPHARGRYQWVYGQLAKKLNAYIRKYHTLTAAQDLSEADYVIYFNLIEFRRILNTVYPYGELFVIVKGSPETNKPPRIVWKAKKILWAGDAIGSLIKELKTLRGES